MWQRLIVMVVCALVLSSGPLLAQVTTASISGTTQDESGGVLPGVTVVVRNLDLGLERTHVTDEQGRYHATNLTLGKYSIQAQLVGFQTAVRDGIELTLGRDAVVDLTLKLGEMSESVIVTGEAPLINTTSATIAGLVDEKKVRDLPLNNRSLIELAPLYTGVTFAETGGSGVSESFAKKLSISGTRYTANSFRIDGIDIGDIVGAAGSVSGNLTGVETIKEFNMVTNAFDAQYGRHTGGVFNAVTKSGTNSLTGSIFGFLRNDALDAANFFDPVDPATDSKLKPDFKRYQFGFAVGGPIVKDKTFVFGSYEGLREDLARTDRFNVPSESARLGIIPGRGQIPVSPAVAPYLASYPRPNGQDFGDGRAEFIRGLNQPTDEDFFTIRADQNLSSSDNFFGRYTFNEGTRLIPTLNTHNIVGTKTWSAMFDETHIFSQSFLNKVLFGFSSTDLSELIDPLPDSVFPVRQFTDWPGPPGEPVGAISVTGLSGWGGGNTLPRAAYTRTYQFKDDMTYSKGSHALKFGAQLEFVEFQRTGLNAGGGVFQFTSLENFLRGTVNQFTALVRGSEPTIVSKQTLFGFYVQDDIKLKPNFTLNVGLRYEAISAPDVKDDRVSNLRDMKMTGATINDLTIGNPWFENPSLKNFAPRVGFAWDVSGDGKMSVRGGAGIFHDQLFTGKHIFAMQVSPPFYTQGTIIANRLPVPIDFPNAFYTQSSALASLPNVEPFQFDADQPVVRKWSINVQREIVSGTSVEIGYAGTQGINLDRVMMLNAPISEIRDGRIFVPSTAPARSPALGRMRGRTTDATSIYHAFSSSLHRRFRDGLQVQVSYTFSKSVDDSSAWGGSLNWTADPADARYFDLKDRGLSAFDVRHSFVTNVTYELPFGSGPVLGGWGVGGILRLNSGSPGTVTSGALPAWMVGVGDYPDLVPGADPSPVLGGPDRYFDPSSFALPVPGFVGNLERNTLIGPGVAVLDFTLTKDVAVSDDLNIQFRSEFYNVANRPNFAMPTLAVFNRDGTVRADAGRVTRTTTSARQIQFGLKILF